MAGCYTANLSLPSTFSLLLPSVLWEWDRCQSVAVLGDGAKGFLSPYLCPEFTRPLSLLHGGAGAGVGVNWCRGRLGGVE